MCSAPHIMGWDDVEVLQCCGCRMHDHDDPADLGHGHGGAPGYDATDAVAEEPRRVAPRRGARPWQSPAVHLSRDRVLCERGNTVLQRATDAS